MKSLSIVIVILITSHNILCQEQVTVKRLALNTYSDQVTPINNFAPVGTVGENLWLGWGGQSSSGTGTQASGNTSVGYTALYSNSSGATNTGVGGFSLYFNTVGSSNTGVGFASIHRNTEGGQNAAVGSYALYNNSTGISNTAVGFASLSDITSGTSNTSVGYEAGKYAANGASNTSSSNSTYIGYDTRPLLNGTTAETVIGYQARGNGSNTVTIGGSSNTHNILQFGKTLIGYSVSQDKGTYSLQVNGQIYATNAAIATSDIRLKEHIVPLQSGLDKIMALHPCTFDFIQGTELSLSKERQIGFIAQDVSAALVGTDWGKSIVPQTGDYLGIAETKLIPLLVRALQEQQEQIEKLSNQILSIQKHIDGITGQVDYKLSVEKK